MPEQPADEQPADEPQVAESVLAADRWSRIVGLFVALGVFVLAQLTTTDPQFNAVVAAVGGIGARVYVPYHASLSVVDPEATSISSHPDAGNYHYGAAGLALLLAPGVALVVMIAAGSFNAAILVGAVVGSAGFLVLRSTLPQG
jgi:hypothetical protein